jgi:2-polyprenyl-3-methyl-5-hydroxy-6-metoxy-1,4-benzoquinol methylase
MAVINVKDNVSQYGRDILERGSYSDTVSLAIRLAGKRINDGLFAACPVEGKRVLDIGSGDGLADLDFLSYGAASVNGYEPCGETVERAKAMAAEKGLADRLSFEKANIYELNPGERFDVTVPWSLVHHPPDTRLACLALAPFTERLLIMEPNGLNPVLKVIERVSAYHRAHEEQSLTLRRTRKWPKNAGF